MGGHSDASAGGAARVPIATQEQMMAAKIDLAYRDFCAHLLIPLNECRKKEYYIPWRCGDEKHHYDKCQYKEYMMRVAQKNEANKAKAAH
eukprot:CAMPEP_0197592312 /NCGR_PEP_ID=MMETSP1326-20131121/15025_1 /TAXON_ID=1155430 /ORGANISM="Genus nov. species nov., Strain RCC2288" /LENGTH=89 /DNA_ID=CAMNT_0043157999 /DNA_START=184 /DNA_END=453 /DNA_ORIENTATION=-